MLLFSVGFLIDQDNVFHPFAVLLPKPESLIIYFLFMSVGFIGEFLVIFFSINSVIVWVSQVFTISTILYPLLNELVYDDESIKVSERKYSHGLRSSKVFPHVYRGTEILMRNWMDLFGLVFIPLQALAGQGGVVTCYLLVRYSNEFDTATFLLTVMVGLGTQQVWVFVLLAAGKATDKSGQAIKSWKCIKGANRLEGKYINRFRKSCKPIPVGIVGVFTIKKLSCLKYIYGLSKSIFRVLVAFGKA